MCHLTPSRVNFWGVDVSFTLARRATSDRRLLSDGAYLAKHDQQSIQCWLVTLEWTAMMNSEGLVLPNHPFVHVTQTKLLACEPAAEIAYHTKTAPCALPTMPFPQ